MSSATLLSVEPRELKFPFELKKQISSCLQLSNKTDYYVAFKLKTTAPKKFAVRPKTGIILPRSTCDVTVTMAAQEEEPPSIQCKGKFMIQSVITTPDVTAKDITREMFNKEPGNLVEERRVKAVYILPPPPQPLPPGWNVDIIIRVSTPNGTVERKLSEKKIFQATISLADSVMEELKLLGLESSEDSEQERASTEAYSSTLSSSRFSLGFLLRA